MRTNLRTAEKVLNILSTRSCTAVRHQNGEFSLDEREMWTARLGRVQVAPDYSDRRALASRRVCVCVCTEPRSCNQDDCHTAVWRNEHNNENQQTSKHNFCRSHIFPLLRSALIFIARHALLRINYCLLRPTALSHSRA